MQWHKKESFTVDFQGYMVHVLVEEWRYQKARLPWLVDMKGGYQIMNVTVQTYIDAVCHISLSL